MAAAGLYDPGFEHDACGVGFVADLSGRHGHGVVSRALNVLCHLEHRGAQGGDPGTGDGAGILTQLPDEFFRAVSGLPLPGPGCYAVGSFLVESVRIGPLPQVLGVRYSALGDVAVFLLAVAGLYLTRLKPIPPARTPGKPASKALAGDSSGDVMST